MKTVTIIKIAVIAVIFGLTSCEKFSTKIEGSGPIVDQTVSPSDFDKIECSLYGNVEISQGDVQEVVFSGQQNIIDHIKTNVKNKEWKIDFEKGNYSYEELTIKIQVPNIKSIVLDGSGDIEIYDFVEQGNLNLNIPGSGEIKLNKYQGNGSLSVRIGGSGSIVCKDEYSGLENLNILISGSGSFDGFQAMTSSCEIDIPGSGECKVNVVDNLDVNITGSGTVTYRGNPRMDLDVNPAGKVIQD